MSHLYVYNTDPTPFLCPLPSCVKYVPEPEDSVLLKTTMSIYRKFNKYPQALRLALMLNDLDLSKEIFLECPDL